MLIYSDYMSVEFTLGSGTASTDTVRSQFDYGARQRRGVRGYDVFSAKLVLNDDNNEMQDWVDFWYSLNYGNDQFYTEQVINGDKTTGKVVRFTSGYSVSQIGANKFIVTVPLELISSSATVSDTGVTVIYTVNIPTVTVV